MMSPRTTLPAAMTIALAAAWAPGATTAADDGDEHDETAHLVSGEEYTVTGALSELPGSALDHEGYLLLTGDLRVVAERAGLPAPAGDDDAIVEWFRPLTGGSPSPAGAETPDSGGAPVVVVPAGWMTDALIDPAAMRTAVGWTLADVDAYASAETPPASFHVVAGDHFDDDVFPSTLSEVADDVVTIGDGDDLELSLDSPNPLSRLGVPQRMATDDDRLAFGPVLADVVAWEDDEDRRSVVTDDDAVRAVARALDAADAVSAVIAPTAGADPAALLGAELDPAQLAELEERMATAAALPLDVVGIGWSTDDDDDAVVTVAYHLTGDTAPDAVIAGLTELYENATSLVTRAPLTELLTLDDVTAGEGVVVATLRPAPERSPIVLFQMLLQRDAPFAVGPG